MYKIDLGKLCQKLNYHCKTLVKSFFVLVIISPLVLVANYATAGYQCTAKENCKMVWSSGGTGTLTCGNPSWDCTWYPDASSSYPPSPPPPAHQPPPTPLPPTMSPAEKIVFCNTAPYEIAADLRSCKAEVKLKRDMQFVNCGVKGTVVWNFSYIGKRISLYHSKTSTYDYTQQCNNITQSYASYSTSMCQAEENRARGRAVGICGPIQW